MIKSFSSKKSGFTLIELLVVISIIGLLSSIVLASLNSARKKAQASAIVQSFIQLRNALEIYRLSNNGQPLGGSNTYAQDTYGSTGFKDALNPLVTSKLISSIPTAPNWPYNGSYFFMYTTGNDAETMKKSFLNRYFNHYYLTCGNTPFKDYTLWFEADTANGHPDPDGIFALTNMPKLHEYDWNGTGDPMDSANYTDQGLQDLVIGCITAP